MGRADDIDDIRERKREELLDGVTSPEEPIHLSDEDHLNGLVADHGVVLADFYADWCGPCQMLDPILEDLAAETDAAVAKVDVDAHQALAREFGVRGVPTLLVFADGEVVERSVGVAEKSELRELVGRYA